MTEIVNRLDSWENVITGIGGPKDKSSGFVFSPLLISSDASVLECLYEEDHISGRIVDAPVDQVFRRGWDFTLSDVDQKECVVDEIDRLEVEDHIDQALRWESLYGGSAVMLGVEDGRSVSDPLNMDRARALHYLNTYNRWELTPSKFYDSPLHPKFGRPEVYRLHPQSSSIGNVGMLVHESRLIIFNGRPTTKRQRIINQHWGQSVLVRAYTSIKQYGSALSSCLASMADSNQAVYKIKGLMDMIVHGNGDGLKARMAAIDEVRSTVNAIIMDADGEDFQRIATSLTELSNLVGDFKLNVSSAAEMPATVLFGQAPAGMNATGDSDMRIWYDKIGHLQKKKVKPALERILRINFQCKNGPTGGVEPEKWGVTFPSPWQPTEKEKAEIRKVNADSDAIYVDLGVLTVEQVARARFSGEESPDEITLSDEEINALGSATLPASGEDVSLIEGDEESDPEDMPIVESLHDVTAQSEDVGMVNARAFAEKMTASGLERCQHDKVNRCPICKIERVRDVEIGTDGKPVFGVKWQAIGEVATGPSSDSGESSPEGVDLSTTTA